jgi:hypothetical protein
VGETEPSARSRCSRRGGGWTTPHPVHPVADDHCGGGHRQILSVACTQRFQLRIPILLCGPTGRAYRSITSEGSGQRIADVQVENPSQVQVQAALGSFCPDSVLLQRISRNDGKPSIAMRGLHAHGSSIVLLAAVPTVHFPSTGQRAEQPLQPGTVIRSTRSRPRWRSGEVGTLAMCHEMTNKSGGFGCNAMGVF